ncbi:DUF1508 domain-containing protein [Arthrobacter sp.]|uniref:YegP family protein n=1 Tax=Arthrobacter sp. TaxID=1667 RepID=UPI002811BA47|nr:DUF1508 domain-containing protein [Arthrobacter sp.]
MAGNFEIFRGDDALYRFRLIDEDGCVLVTSSGYDRKREAVTAITAVRENAAMGHIRDHSEPATRRPLVRHVKRRATAS